MRRVKRCFAVLCLAAAAGAAAQAPPGPAWQIVPDGAQVQHCAVSRGVLTLRYLQHGQAASAPAFHTAAIYQACARAGHALPEGAQRRGALSVPAQRIALAPLPGTGAGPAGAAAPSFSLQSGGATLAIDGRNDSDTAYHCVINLEWAADGDAPGSRAVTAQATLPPRQSNRVLYLSAPGGGARIVGLPRWSCRPG
jgi:hypothetical protein